MAIEYNNKSLIGTGSSSSPQIVIEAASIPATPESDRLFKRWSSYNASFDFILSFTSCI